MANPEKGSRGIFMYKLDSVVVWYKVSNFKNQLANQLEMRKNYYFL